MCQWWSESSCPTRPHSFKSLSNSLQLLMSFFSSHFQFEVATIWCRIRLYRPYCKLFNLLKIWLVYINNVKKYHLATVLYIRWASSSLDHCFLYFFPHSLGLLSNHSNFKLKSSHYKKRSICRLYCFNIFAYISMWSKLCKSGTKLIVSK